MISSSPENDKSLKLRNFFENSIQNQEEIVALNNPTASSLNPILFINSAALTKELYSKEENMKKLAVIPGYKIGFFDGNGEEALEKRALFKKFFDFKNLASIVPKIDELVIKNVQKLKSKNWDSESQDFKKICLEKNLLETFSDITDIILVGEKFKSVNIDGMRLSQAISKSRLLLLQDFFSPANALSSGMVFDSKLTSKHREAINLRKKIKTVIWDIFMSRKQEKNEAKGTSNVNIIDLLIEDDSTRSKENQWTKEEVLGHFILFQSVGSNAIRVFSTQFLELISR